MKKFSDLSTKFQNIVKLLIAITAFLSISIPFVKNRVVPYLNFIVSGPELVRNVDELKKSVFVLTGVVASDLKDVDDNVYYLYYEGEKLSGRIKTTLSGNMYVFLPSEDVGERALTVNYNNDKKLYYFIDFTGTYRELFVEHQ